MKFSDRLASAVRSKKSCLVLGLDPVLEKLPSHLPKTTEGIFEFCQKIIDSTEDLIVGVKPNLAFFEIFGSEGIAVLERLLAYCRAKNLFIILDGKRGDIGSTAEMYARACLEPGMPLESDACTVNPFCGSDGLRPFVEHCEKHEKGIFVLVRTSNPSAIEIQGGESEVSVVVANLIEDLGLSTISEENFFHSVGAVVGATLDPEFLKFWREEMPHSWFLCPGVGTQGGDFASVLSLQKNGVGVLVPVSRSVIFAGEGVDFAEKSREKMREFFDKL